MLDLFVLLVSLFNTMRPPQKNGEMKRRGSKSSIGSGTIYGFGSPDAKVSGPDGGDRPDGTFDGAAEADGVEIWRVEGKNVVKKFNEPLTDRPAPDVGVDAHQGTLYTGDVYVILWSSVSHPAAFFH